MKKKFFGGLVGLSAALLLFSGCGGTKGNAKAKDENDNGKVQLTGLIYKDALTLDNSKIEWLNKLEKKLDVDIKWEEVTSDWDQKKAPILASGDIPDIMVSLNVVTDSEFAKFPGLFEDLSDDMDSLPNVQKMFDEQPITQKLATQNNGAIYGLSKYQRFWPESATRQYINKEWLKRVGMEAPTTWDELYNVLVAFKEQDANGNGDPNDEIPLDWYPSAVAGFGFWEPVHLLASEGIAMSEGGNIGFYAENGKVSSFLTDDRYKDVIKFLNKCWKAGLINPKVFSQDHSAAQATGRQEPTKVGVSWGYEAGDRFGATNAKEYETFAPLKVSADSKIEPTWGFDNSVNYGTNVITLSAKCKHKKKALEFINALYDPETSLQVLFGSLGSDIEKDGDTYKVLPPKDKGTDASTWKWTRTWADRGPGYIPDNMKVELPDDLKAVQEQNKIMQPYYKKINQEEQIVPFNMMKFSEEDNTTFANNNVPINNEVSTKFAKWVTKGGIDGDWDKYKDTLKGYGLNDNLKIVQKGYNNFYKK